MAGTASATQVAQVGAVVGPVGAVTVDVATAEERLADRRQRREDLLLALAAARARRRRRARGL